MPQPTTPATPATQATHAAHDAYLVAAYAAGDATGAELEAATALVAACTGCAALHHDLRSIAAALPAIPAARRTRDFRLTPTQAASLRPGGWRRLLAPFAGPRFAFAAPLGSGLAALGIAGILLAGPGLAPGGSTAGPVPAAGPIVPAERNGAGETGSVPPYAVGAPSPGAPSPGRVMITADASAAPAPAASEAPGFALGPADQVAVTSGPDDTAAQDPGAKGAGGAVPASTIPVVVPVSIVGILAGLVLVVLRFVGRSAVRAE
jgi:hypothetical protein